MIELRWYVESYEQEINDGASYKTVTEEPVLQCREGFQMFNVNTGEPVSIKWGEWQKVPTVYEKT